MAMFVKYFIPEDGDEQLHPNVFKIQQQGQQVALGTIKKSFPLPGSYHFRFLHCAGNNGSSSRVWLDVVDDDALIPVTDDGILAKVSRIHNNRCEGQEGRNINGASFPSKINTQQSEKSRPTSEKLINFDSDSGGLSPISKSVDSRGSSTTAAGINLSSGSDDLIGFNATLEPVVSSSSSRNPSNIDLFGLDSLQPVPAAPMQQQPRPAMSAMGGMVRPASAGGFGGDPFSGLGASGARAPPNPYQPRPPNRPF